MTDPADQTALEIGPDDEVEGIRLAEDLHYARNRAAFGKRTWDLVTEYLRLYEHLWQVATASMPVNPIEHANLFTHQMLLECRADLVRTMLLLTRTHLIEAHAQTRRAIECCAWARRIYQEPTLVEEWLNIDMGRPPSKAWKENIKASLLFPKDNPHLDLLRHRYHATSRCVHPFRFSFEGRTSVGQNPDGTLSLDYSFFDPEGVRVYLPTRFLWTLQTHDLIFNVFEEIFSREISVQHDDWKQLRKTVMEAQTEVGKMWIAVTERVEARKRENTGQ